MSILQSIKSEIHGQWMEDRGVAAAFWKEAGLNLTGTNGMRGVVLEVPIKLGIAALSEIVAVGRGLTNLVVVPASAALRRVSPQP